MAQVGHDRQEGAGRRSVPGAGSFSSSFLLQWVVSLKAGRLVTLSRNHMNKFALLLPVFASLALAQGGKYTLAVSDLVGEESISPQRQSFRTGCAPNCLRQAA